MFLSILNKETFSLARKANVVDMDTGEIIPYVRWANTKTGRFRQIITNEKT